MIQAYSLKKDGKKSLSENFRVAEFACPDGTDLILIDERLVTILQMIRNYFDRSVIVQSGYRTLEYNKLIGGDPFSAHLKGQAADIDVGRLAEGIPARTVAMMAEASGVQRIGLYIYENGQSWIHIGSEFNELLWFEIAPGVRTAVTTFIPTLRRQFLVFTNRYETTVAQTILKRAGFYTGVVDGRYGPGTGFQKAVLSFQRAQQLKQDGIIGPATWNRLFKV